MSREHDPEESSSWREIYLHNKPLVGRTEDPRAKDFDRAAVIFVGGVKLARLGDFEAATVLIKLLLPTRTF